MDGGNWLKQFYFVFLDYLPEFTKYQCFNLKKIFFSLSIVIKICFSMEITILFIFRMMIFIGRTLG